MDASHALTPRTDVALGPPSRTVGHRLWFGWTCAWVAFWSVLISPVLVAHSALQPTARTFQRWMRLWARILMWGLGIRLVVEQRGTPAAGPVVYAANHQSAFDIPATSVGLPKPFLYVARQELRSWPIVGWVLAKSACLFLDRSNARRALESLREAAVRIRGGESVLLFPEGGRTYSHETAPFMRGPFLLAVEAGVPVVPVALVGNVGVVDEKSRTARPGTIRIVLGEPVPTEGLTRSDAAALSARVREAIEAELEPFRDRG